AQIRAVVMMAAMAALMSGTAAALPKCGGETCPAGEVCCKGHCALKDVCGCGPQKSVCGKACVDKSSDPKHCGTCGHSCQGLCNLSACVPVTVQIVRPSLSVLDLHVSASSQYVLATNGGSFDLRDRNGLAPVADTVLSGDSSASLNGIQALF